MVRSCCIPSPGENTKPSLGAGGDGLALQARLNLLPRTRGQSDILPCPVPPGESAVLLSWGWALWLPRHHGPQFPHRREGQSTSRTPSSSCSSLDLAAALLKGVLASGLGPKSPVQPTYPQARVLAPHPHSKALASQHLPLVPLLTKPPPASQGPEL